MKVTTKATAGLYFGLIDGDVVCGPYMNKGMATRQANRIVAKREAEAATKVDPLDQVRAEGRKAGLTEAQIERFITRQS